MKPRENFNLKEGNVICDFVEEGEDLITACSETSLFNETSPKVIS